MNGLVSKIEKEIIRAKDFQFNPSKISISKSELASMIDHTLLSPDATSSQIDKVCDEALKFNFYSVCVNSLWVPHVFERVNGKSKVTSVVAFPFGAVSSKIKSVEASWAVEHGADEIDMVINIGALKDSEYTEVYDDIKAVVEAARGKTVKVIIETALLSFEEKVAACVISKEAGAHFVKTSTGYSKGGAVDKDVALMRFVVGEKMGVKASGGIHSYEDAAKMIAAGANRIGASRSVEIIGGAK
ncbi:MAG: deoxyribose-phosphate aldolase [Mesoaciditoga sp.]|uniref:deoxyribose-phosphate aldolase n=1 Tax=Athalassotoga sp. TaxID=2022597 RepID=UPI000CBCC35C|nr:MAG: deoxyribose-phosphate aldolase [Mesoaciditoga sp.]HEU23573.1 deoxyribose-phosphate aldolase [Mesoaciditoga lauensis]